MNEFKHRIGANEVYTAFARRLHAPEDVGYNAGIIREAVEAVTWTPHDEKEKARSRAMDGAPWLGKEASDDPANE